MYLIWITNTVTTKLRAMRLYPTQKNETSECSLANKKSQKSQKLPNLAPLAAAQGSRYALFAGPSRAFPINYHALDINYH